MKKMISVLLVMLAVWGCSDDDDKRIEDLGLPSDFFYQTAWKGSLRYMTNFGWSEEKVGLEFVSDSVCLVQEDDDDVETALYVVEGKVFHLSRDEDYLYDPYGYWFLTYVNESQDSLVFEQRVYADEPLVMTLTKVEYQAGEDGEKAQRMVEN